MYSCRRVHWLLLFFCCWLFLLHSIHCCRHWLLPRRRRALNISILISSPTQDAAFPLMYKTFSDGLADLAIWCVWYWTGVVCTETTRFSLAYDTSAEPDAVLYICVNCLSAASYELCWPLPLCDVNYLCLLSNFNVASIGVLACLTVEFLYMYICLSTPQCDEVANKQNRF